MAMLSGLVLLALVMAISMRPRPGRGLGFWLIAVSVAEGPLLVLSSGPQLFGLSLVLFSATITAVCVLLARAVTPSRWGSD